MRLNLIAGISLFLFLLIVSSPLKEIPWDKRNWQGGIQKVSIQQEKDCLVELLWYEGRNTSKKELTLITDVVINRVHSSKYPSTICEVKDQKMQFSYRNHLKEGEKLSIKLYNALDREVYRKIKVISENAIQQDYRAFTGVSYIKQSNLPSSTLWYATKEVSKKVKKITRKKKHWINLKEKVKVDKILLEIQLAKEDDFRHNFFH